MKFGLRTWLIAAVALLALLLWEALIGRKTHFNLDGLGFFAWFGFGACVLMVLITLLIGRVVKRGDDYYDD